MAYSITKITAVAGLSLMLATGANAITPVSDEVKTLSGEGGKVNSIPRWQAFRADSGDTLSQACANALGAGSPKLGECGAMAYGLQSEKFDVKQIKVGNGKSYPDPRMRAGTIYWLPVGADGSTASTSRAPSQSTGANVPPITAEQYAALVSIAAKSPELEAFFANAPQFADAIRGNRQALEAFKESATSRIDGNAKSIADLEGQVVDNARSIADLNGQVGDNVRSIADLEGRVEDTRSLAEQAADRAADARNVADDARNVANTAADDASTALAVASDASGRVTDLEASTNRRFTVVGEELAQVKKDQGAATTLAEQASTDAAAAIAGLEQFKQGDAAGESTQWNWIYGLGIAGGLLLLMIFGLWQKIRNGLHAHEQLLNGKAGYAPGWFARVVLRRKARPTTPGLTDQVATTQEAQSKLTTMLGHTNTVVNELDSRVNELDSRVDRVVAVISGVDFDRKLVSAEVLAQQKPGMHNAIELPVTAKDGSAQWLLKIERVGDLYMIHGVSRRKGSFEQMQPVAACNVSEKLDAAAFDGRISDATRIVQSHAA